MENKKYYVAYGSNLHIGQMTFRCPTAKVVGATALENRRLLFRGGRGSAVATVEPNDGGSVPVLIWEIQPKDEEALDRYEGYPFLYRKEYVDITLDGEPIEAMIYIMNVNDGRPEEKDAIPKEYRKYNQHFHKNQYRPLNQSAARYYTTILDGYKAAGFDVDILRKATEVSFEVGDMPK